MPAQVHQQKTYGEWAFLLGLVLVLVVGLSSVVPAIGGSLGLIYAILGILGLAVGLLNISEKEVDSFLIAMVALMMVSSGLQYVLLGLNVATLSEIMINLLKALTAFVAPAALIVAILSVYRLAKEK